MKINHKNLAEYLTEKKFNYWGITMFDELHFLNERVNSINLRKNLIFNLDSDFQISLVGKFVQLTMDYINEHLTHLNYYESIKINFL